uniref:Pyridoxal phosphate homeostasis protein n=1 Tax=Mesocestoides corti TaxID=53468 RepID=A0A5K3EHH6_MESCO
MDQEKRSARFRVVGSLIPRLIGREVCVLGKVVSVVPSGQQISLRCADGVEVKCTLPSPLQVSPESCIVEVQGLITSANELQATSEPIIFPREASNKFDLDRYGYAVNLTVNFDRLYTQSMVE